MWPVSARWDAALRVGHEAVTTAEVWVAGVRQTLPDGSTSLKVESGTVTVDESSKIRRTLSMTIDNTELSPVKVTDLFASPNTDVKVFSGVRYTEGDTEMVPVGVFRVSSAMRPSYFGGVQLTGADYSKPLQDARFLAPWATPAGSLVTDEIVRMATDALPGLTVVNLTGSRVLTQAASWDRDRWDAITKLAQSIAAEAFFDAAGTFVIRPFPQVTSTSTSVWTVDAGTASGVVSEVSTGVSTDAVYNAVVASSSQTGVAVTAVAYQTSGPYAWSSTFKRPRFYSSPVLVTVDGCQSAATAILARSVQFSRQISPVAVPNPALEGGDMAQVVLMPDSSGVVASEVRALSKIVLPLQPGSMSLDTRVGVDVLTTSDVGSLA